MESKVDPEEEEKLKEIDLLKEIYKTGYNELKELKVYIIFLLD